MSLRHRVERIERDAPAEREPLHVRVRRHVKKPTPDGPMTTRVLERTVRGDERTEWHEVAE
jgi:hypothetical protein